MESTELQHYGVKGMKWGVRKTRNMKDAEKAKKQAQNRKKAERQKQATNRGAKAVTTALEVAGALYYADLVLTGGSVTRATAKSGKSAVKRTLNNIGDQMFDYSILDKDGKVLKRYN